MYSAIVSRRKRSAIWLRGYDSPEEAAKAGRACARDIRRHDSSAQFFGVICEETKKLVFFEDKVRGNRR